MQSYCTADYGRLGRVALKAIYKRAYAGRGSDKLTDGIQASLRTLEVVFTDAPPKVNSINDDHDVEPIMHADAFFEVHGQTQRLSDFKQKWKLCAARP